LLLGVSFDFAGYSKIEQLNSAAASEPKVNVKGKLICQE